MVRGVCQRALGNCHDADDAFQATFLVLTRKAATVVPRDMVGNWLYGVARTTAIRAKAIDARRRQREKQVAQMPQPETVPHEPDLVPVLDEELGRLPRKYRVPIVLCDLEGRTRKEVARQLRIPEGTLSSRLTTARKMLAKRLARHGFQVSTAALATVLLQNTASACVPPPLLSSLVKAATLLAARHTAAADAMSANVAALVEGVLKTMLLKKLKVLATVVLLAAVLGTAGFFYRTQPAAPAQPPGKVAAAEPAQAVGKDTEPSSLAPSAISRLPSGPMPRQALVSLEKGQLVVRTLDVTYEPNAVHFQGKTRTSYQKAETLRTRQIELEMVKAFDVRGKGIDAKELPELLKREIVALISTDSHAADPLNLRLFREGTLLFILPAASGAAAGLTGPNHFSMPPGGAVAPVGPSATPPAAETHRFGPDTPRP
jgi:RNA polymerase sigma factor (sigma-70 family)